MANEANSKTRPERKEKSSKRRTNESSENMSGRECTDFVSGTFCFISSNSCPVRFLETNRSNIYKKRNNNKKKAPKKQAEPLQPMKKWIQDEQGEKYKISNSSDNQN